VEDRLTKLNEDNSAKLEEMRVTVDEKLHATLQTRLTESFGQVTTHLGEVQKGLGEMKELATGVGDLKKVLSNVKSRGVVGEFQLGQQLEQMFSPEQYIKNARIKPNTQESVEYALKFPTGEGGGHTLLAIDAKFPKEDWERLEHAYETGEGIEVAGKAFERSIRAEGKRICDKYIDPPITMPHAIMFLPTEALYAEVVRRPGLQSEIQSQCRVTIAGPSTFMAILTSFQMGFHTLAIQKKGDEVWRVLSSTKTEFEKFGGLMDKVKKQVDTVQNTLGDLSSKTRTINRALKNVSSLDAGAPVSNLIGFEEIAAVAPLLAASGEDD
jgi:DNA recombination protein RmuC